MVWDGMGGEVGAWYLILGTWKFGFGDGAGAWLGIVRYLGTRWRHVRGRCLKLGAWTFWWLVGWRVN